MKARSSRAVLSLASFSLVVAGCASVGGALESVLGPPKEVVGTYELAGFQGRSLPVVLSGMQGQRCPDGGEIQHAVLQEGSLELRQNLTAVLRGNVEVQCRTGGQVVTALVPQNSNSSFTAVGDEVRVRIPGESEPLLFRFDRSTGRLASANGVFTYRKQDVAEAGTATARHAGGASDPLTESLRRMVSQEGTFARALAEEREYGLSPVFGQNGTSFGRVSWYWTEELPGGRFPWVHQVGSTETPFARVGDVLTLYRSETGDTVQARVTARLRFHSEGNDWEGGISGGGWAYRYAPQGEEAEYLVFPGTGDFRPKEEASASLLPRLRTMARAERERALPEVYKLEGEMNWRTERKWTRAALRAEAMKDQEITPDQFHRLRGPQGRTLYVGYVPIINPMTEHPPIGVQVIVDEAGRVVHRTEYIPNPYWLSGRGDLNGDGVDELFFSEGVAWWDGSAWNFPEAPFWSPT